MARTTRSTSAGCLCRVPLSESAVPVLGTTEALDAWAAANDVKILPNHRGEPSIDLLTAYRLYDEQQAADLARSQAAAERVAAERETLRTAQERRQQTYSAAYVAAVKSGKSSASASRAAWDAVHEAESGLPASIREQLGRVTIPTVLPPLVSTIATGDEW